MTLAFLISMLLLVAVVVALGLSQRRGESLEAKLRELERQVASAERWRAAGKEQVDRLIASNDGLRLELRNQTKGQELVVPARIALAHEQRAQELESEVETLQARVEHQKAELTAVHHELVNQQQIATMTLELERDERQARQALMAKFVDGFVNLRRDGFNPGGFSEAAFRIPIAPNNQDQDEPRAGELSAEKVHKWLRCVELIQERAGGDAVLQSTMTGDAERWRSLGIPFEEIENRIRDGYSE